MDNKDKKSTGLSPHRLEALSDGIFAFAMTLLVLSINLPESDKGVNAASYILSQLPNFWNFTLGFLILAFIWLNLNQGFHHIKKTNFGLIVFNILLLLFVVLLPFSTSLLNDFPDTFIAEIFFNANMLILSLILSMSWLYAQKSNLVETMDETKHIVIVTRRQYIFPAISLLAVILTFLTPGWSTLVYILIPILVYWPRKKLNS